MSVFEYRHGRPAMPDSWGSEWSAHARSSRHRRSWSMPGSEKRVVRRRMALEFKDAIAIRSSDKAKNNQRAARVFLIAVASRKQHLAFPIATTYVSAQSGRLTNPPQEERNQSESCCDRGLADVHGPSLHARMGPPLKRDRVVMTAGAGQEPNR